MAPMGNRDRDAKVPEGATGEGSRDLGVIQGVMGEEDREVGVPEGATSKGARDLGLAIAAGSEKSWRSHATIEQRGR